MDKKGSDKKSSDSVSGKLLKAIKDNKIETVKEIVSAENFVYPTDSNPSPLFIAASQNPPLYRIISLLCKHGADPLLELPLEMNQTQLALRAATQMTQDNISEQEWNKRFILFTLQLEVGDLAAKFMNDEISDKEAKDKILELKRQESKIKRSLENPEEEEAEEKKEKKTNIGTTSEEVRGSSSSSSSSERGEGELGRQTPDVLSPVLSPGAPGSGSQSGLNEGEGDGEGEPGTRQGEISISRLSQSGRGEEEEGEPGG